MSSSKRLILLAGLATGLAVASTSEASAQAHAVPVHRAVVVRPYVGYAYPYLYAPYYDPFWFGAAWAYPPYYPYYALDPGAAMKLEVKPRQAEVYVDGYYAGVVNDFDGTFQRLRINPGEHEVDVWLEGYRTLHQKVYLQPDKTFTIKHTLEKLPDGEKSDPRPQPAAPPPQFGAPGAGQPPPPYQQPRGGRRPPQEPPPPPGAPRDPRAVEANAFGSIAIRVQPADAEVLVDGEKWRAPEGPEPLVIELPEGRHTVEIQKAGYRGYVTDVDVRRGQTLPLNVSLRTQ